MTRTIYVVCRLSDLTPLRAFDSRLHAVDWMADEADEATTLYLVDLVVMGE